MTPYESICYRQRGGGGPIPGIFLSASIVFPSLPFFLFFFLVNAVSLKVNYSLLTSNINHVINLPIERLNDHFSAQLFVSIFVHF